MSTKINDKRIPIHLFTIVLNGEPFIRHHIEEFKKLSGDWHWHIVEGVAALKYDTAWSVPNGGKIPDDMHRKGLSKDGTTEYLNELIQNNPGKVTVYRLQGGQIWDGKVAMVSAPLPYIKEECILVQVDSDELWRAEQLETLRDMFAENPSRTGAYMHCHYFVGPRKFVPQLNVWATDPHDWPRAWRYQPGMKWWSHEPAALANAQGQDVVRINPFTRDETLARGVYFEHFSYVLAEQVRFKQNYYGYKDAVKKWENLQLTKGPVKPKDYLPWANRDGVIDDWGPERGPTLGDKFLNRNQKMKVAGIDDIGSKDLTQMDKESDFASSLREIIGLIRPKKIIETGTYHGEGTTKVIASALRDYNISDSMFFSIEVNPQNIAYAVRYLESQGLLDKVRILQGLSLPQSALPSENEIESEFVRSNEYGSVFVDHKEEDRAKLYHAETQLRGGQDDLLKKTMDYFDGKPDLVLLDSAGHVGELEFDYLLSMLKSPCYIALDDIYHVKHHKSFTKLQSDSRFKVLTSSKERFGSCLVYFDPALAKIQQHSGQAKTENKLKVAGIDDGGYQDLTQMDKESDFARVIRETIQAVRPTKLIETGTYHGQGTTKVITSALRDAKIDNARFFSIEVNPNNIQEAQRYLHSQGLLDRVTILHGLSLPKSLLPTEADIQKSLVENPEYSGIFVDHQEGDRARLYHGETTLKGGQEDLLKKVLDVFEGKPDFVLLDSAGHVGSIEFDYLIANLKAPCYIALDDIYHVKHFKSLKKLEADPRFKMIASSKERFGSCLTYFDPRLGASAQPAKNESSSSAVGSSVAIAAGDVAQANTTGLNITGARNILWVQSNSQSEALSIMSALPQVKRSCPQASIHVVCEESLLPLYENCRSVSSVITFDKAKIGSDSGYQKEIELKIRNVAADVCINGVSPRDLVADYLSLVSGAGVRVASGNSIQMDTATKERNTKAYTTIVQVEHGDMTGFQSRLMEVVGLAEKSGRSLSGNSAAQIAGA
jgi:predicted O-methyltransferase YrrM